MHEPPQKNIVDDARNSFNIVAFATRCFATMCELFLHEGFGCRYLGVHAAINLLLIPCWCIFWPGRSAMPLIVFWALYLLAIVKARIGILCRGRGVMVHSRYGGTPLYLRLRPHANEMRVRSFTEPLLVMTTGAVCWITLDPVVGSLLVVAGFGLALNIGIGEMVAEAEAQDIYDAMVEAENRARRVRRMRDEW